MKKSLIYFALFVFSVSVWAESGDKKDDTISSTEASFNIVQIASLSPSPNSTNVSAAVGLLVINTVQALTWDGVGLPTIILHKSTGPSSSTQVKQFFFNNANDIEFSSNQIIIKGLPRLEYGQTYFLTFDAVSVFKDTNGNFITLEIDTREWLYAVENNAAPTDISLDPSSIAENNTNLDVLIGSLTTTDANVGETFTYSLVAGTGSTDNNRFQIAGTTLRSNTIFNYESQSSYSIRVRSTDSGGLFTEKILTVSVNNVNEEPTFISLSANTIDENNTVNAVIGTFTTTDTDNDDTHTYTLVSGTGSTDNANFNISGNSLRTGVVFDYETKNSYSIRVRSTDQGGLSIERTFAIFINDLTEGGGNSAPTDITLSASAINENNAVNAVIGTLSSTDPDVGNTFTYSLVSGTGSTDNASFNISGNSLRASVAFDFETKSSYNIRVRTTDQGGLTFEKQFTITILDVNEDTTGPTIVSLNPVDNATDVALTADLVATFNEPIQGSADRYIEVRRKSNGFIVISAPSNSTGPFEISGNTMTIRLANYTSEAPIASTEYYVTFAPGAIQDLSGNFHAGFTDNNTWTFTTVGETNNAPTNITLSASSINENNVVNAVIGTLSSTDPDAGNTFNYSLVSGTGSTDNGSFNISGNSLRASIAFDFETKSSYSIRLRTTDQGGLTFEKQFTITVNNVNEAPTNIALSASSINENNAINAVIGTLSTTDPDAGNTFTYALVSGTGSTDNGSFNISDNSLRASVAFDFETKSTYSIRVRSTDQGGLSFEKQFTITVNNVNESPTNITLSASSINENNAVNAVIGTLSSTDPDAGNTFTYSLMSGAGSTDNGSFNISGNSLRASVAFDFETKSSYSIRVRTIDQGGLTFEKQFTITINDVNEETTDTTPPSIVSLSPTEDQINVPVNAVLIATFSEPIQFDGEDQAVIISKGTNQSFTHFLASNDARLTIDDNVLTIDLDFDLDYETTYWVWLKGVVDLADNYYPSSAATAWSFTTAAMEVVNNAPTDISLTVTSINENNSVNAVIGTLTTTDPDAGNTFTYSLVSGTGSTDNGSFNINGNSLRASEAFNFEAKNSYSIRIRTTDQGGLSFEKAFTINVNNVNEAPTDLTLSATSTAENNAVNAVIGSFGSVDPDNGETFTYSLVSGTGGTDNSSFNISGNSLRASTSFDFEAQSTYSIRVRTTDNGGLSFEMAFTINVTDIDERQAQTITFEPIADKLATDAPFEINVNASSGLTVLLNISGPATLSGTTVTLTGQNGTVTITANQAGNADFLPASEVSVSFEVTGAVLSLEEEVGLNIYPNPVVNYLNISARATLAVRVTSLEGRLIWTGMSGQPIDMTAVSKGLYLVEVMDGKSKQVYKVLKIN